MAGNNFKEPGSHPGNQEYTGGNFASDPEGTLVTPRFDDEAVLHAKPAVPLAQIRAQLTSHKIFIAVALIAGLALGILGSILTMRYIDNPPTQIANQRPAQRRGDLQPDKATSQPKSSSTDSQQPQDNLQTQEGLPEAQVTQDESSKPVTNQSDEEAQEQQPEEASSPSPDLTTKEAEEQELRQAFHSWIQATNERDIDRQMSFYHAKVDTYYRTRGASRRDIHSEKNRVFGRADKISIEADEPMVKINPDSQQATMRFRKRYNIEGQGLNRSGTVLQELRWQRVNGKWRIVSERDLKVLP